MLCEDVHGMDKVQFYNLSDLLCCSQGNMQSFPHYQFWLGALRYTEAGMKQTHLDNGWKQSTVMKHIYLEWPQLHLVEHLIKLRNTQLTVSDLMLSPVDCPKFSQAWSFSASLYGLRNNNNQKQGRKNICRSDSLTAVKNFYTLIT